ncbi:MAG: class I SAM-dependent methyltransferase [Aureliella sp.]
MDETRLEIRRAAETLFPNSVRMRKWHEDYVRWHEARLALDLKMVIENGSSQSAAKIIEVGAIPPVLTLALSNLGLEVIGVDIDPQRYGTSIAEHSLDVRQCNIETQQLPVEESFADVVIFNEVFEHLRINPIYTMTEVLKVLKPGGTLYLSTPNLLSLRGLNSLLRKGEARAIGGDIFDEFSKLDTLGHMGHVREYTPTEVRQFLCRCGFTCDGVVFRGAETRAESFASKFIPWLLPFFTVIASKPKDEV